MPVEKEQVAALTKDASEAANLIRKYVEEDETIQLISHIDADGLAAAGIMGTALARLDATFRLQATKWMDDQLIDHIAEAKPPLTIFTDLGSGYLDLLVTKLSNHSLIILDHHEPTNEAPHPFTHVNPHLNGIDGSRDLSGAGVAYLVAKELDKRNVDLAHLAVVGALGDIQDKYEKRKLGGANEPIVKDAIDAGYLNVETDLLFFGRETRPIHKAVASTTNPFIPDISGEEDKSLALLASLGIEVKHADKWRALRDLSKEEKTKLYSAIADHFDSKGFPSDTALNLIGTVYTLDHEDEQTPLRDAREFTVMLNATGRMDKAGLGVALCMGDRLKCLEEATLVIKEYRQTINKCLNWVTEKPERMKELSSTYVIHGENFVYEDPRTRAQKEMDFSNVNSPVSSILSRTLSNSEKPIIVYSVISGEENVKVSARAVETLLAKGLNLGEVMRIAADKHTGRGGGHDIAAGAQVPIKNVEAFIQLVDKLVKKQLDGI